MPSRYYVIQDGLVEVDADMIPAGNARVTVTSVDEFRGGASLYELGIDLEMDFDASHISTTKAVVNFDSLAGTFSIPDRSNMKGPQHGFLFAIDEEGVFFINDDGTAQGYIDRIQRTKRWKNPSLERFLHDFLEEIIQPDLSLLEGYDREMDLLEEDILADREVNVMKRLTLIRSELQDLRIHYEQLHDMCHELEENENDFFNDDNLRFFHMFTERLERLQDIVTVLRDQSQQVRDLYQSHLSEQQNRIVTLLTVVTTIAVPLTFLTGWYGMNFQYMPELDEPWAYPVLILACLGIAGAFIYWFKKKKWL